ncbi:MAG: winged helix-turn-helix domain-containing protein [Microbacteriaceae bacterium]
MPSRNPPELPKELGDAADALGSRLRVALLRSVAEEGPATRAELARRLGLKYAAQLEKALSALEGVGILTVDPGRDEPGRLKRTYAIDPARYAAVVVAIAKLNPDRDVMLADLRTLLE